jgi:hypothetical protein
MLMYSIYDRQKEVSFFTEIVWFSAAEETVFSTATFLRDEILFTAIFLDLSRVNSRFG